MGKRDGQVEGAPLAVGQTSARLITPDALFWRVNNMIPTDEGGLISIKGPTKVISSEGGDSYGTGATYGIFHGRLAGGERDCLLIHVDDQIWELAGWDQRWRVIVGPTGTNPLYTDTILAPAQTDYPTQFVATPTGIVVIPAFGRAYFFDGEKCIPLGYSEMPGPPVALGPENSSDRWWPNHAQPLYGINDVGYAIDGLVFPSPTGLPPYFRYGRVGTISTPADMPITDERDRSHVVGYLEPGRWRGMVQWIDCFGNLSPLSPPSNDVKVTREPSMKFTGPVDGLYSLTFCQAEMVRKQIGWSSISPGPPGTIGRMVLRTKDLVNSGEAGFYEVPRDAAANAQSFATLPDNESAFYPDNIPDEWLINPSVDVVAVPMFRLAVMAFGRLFIGNFRDDPGAIRWSMVGRWGTFERNALMYPDPTASMVTGFHAVTGGLLVFTETSTFMLTPNADGNDFRVATVSTDIGCVAPCSIATLRNGLTVWLGRDGFYGFTPEAGPTFLFDAQRYHAKRFNRAIMHRAVAAFEPRSGQYRCWISYENAGNQNMCFCYDGSAWHTRDETAATGVTVTNDHRRLMIISGKFGNSRGAWVIDHGGDVQPCEMVTAWIRNMRSKDRSSSRFVWLWLRETGSFTSGDDQIRVDVYRDYRSEIISTSWVQAYPVESSNGPANPSLWDTAVYGAAAVLRIRRPYWVRATIDVSSCEVFRLKISCENEMEILAVSFDEMPRDSAGAQAYGV